MKNKTPITETEKMKAFGDTLITTALMELEKSGMPPEMILDRLGTCFGAHYAKLFGKANTVAMLNHMARRVEAGAFDSVTCEGVRH